MERKRRKQYAYTVTVNGKKLVGQFRKRDLPALKAKYPDCKIERHETCWALADLFRF